VQDDVRELNSPVLNTVMVVDTFEATISKINQVEVIFVHFMCRGFF
jgi:hypothetical protein